MNMTLYIGFSVLETYAMFYFMFKVFKIEIYPVQMIFSSVIMAFISYVLRDEYGVPQIDVFVQMLLMFLFVWMMFRIHIFYATILTGVSYQFYMLLQTAYYYIMQQAGLFDTKIPYILSSSVFILQTLSAATAFFIGWIVYKNRKGFDFVPDKPNGRIFIHFRDKVLFALIIPSFFIIAATMYLAEYSDLFHLVPFIYGAILFFYIYLSYKKDWTDE